MGREIKEIMGRFPAGKKEMLIPVLQAVQEETGHLSGEILEEVGKYLNLPSNKVFGVATFYDQFRFKPHGRYHFQVCSGTHCHVFGNPNLLTEMEKMFHVKAGGVTRDGKYSLEAVPCLGACEQGPIVLINNKPYPGMTPEILSKIIESFKD